MSTSGPERPGDRRDASVRCGDDSSSSKTLTFGELGVGGWGVEVLGGVQPPGDLCRPERVLVPPEHPHAVTPPGAMRCGWNGAGSIVYPGQSEGGRGDTHPPE